MSRHSPEANDCRPGLADELLQAALKLGLTAAHAAEIFRNREAEEALRIDGDLEIIKAQGQVDESIDLRLIPFGAALTVSIATGSVHDGHGRLNYKQQEITFVRGTRGFLEKEVASRSLIKHLSIFGPGKIKPSYAESTPSNRLVSLAGAESTGKEEGGHQIFNLVPRISRFHGLSNSGISAEAPFVWPEDATAKDLFVVGGKEGSVQAAVLNLEYLDRDPLVVFGKPFNILNR